MEALYDYGPIKCKQEYRIISDGPDWYLVAVKGKSVYICKWVFDES